MLKIIQVSTLWSLQDIEDFYYVIDENTVVNINNNVIKKATKSKQRGYWYYTLQTKDKTQKKVPKHKINALAFIENRPYDLIEHKDDNKDNNSPSNLMFSNHRDNMYTAYNNGISNHPNTKRFLLIDLHGNQYEGTTKEISKLSGVPRSSLYCAILNNRSYGKKFKYIKEL